jgi:hypothetical protein
LSNHRSPPLHLEIRLDLPQLAGKVVLVNSSSADIHVWRMGNQWGDEALSFEVLQGSHVWRVAQVYTRNVPSSVLIPAGATQEWPFDLKDGQWEAGVPIDQLMAPGAQLIAIYDVPPSSDATQQGVWTGQLRSGPARLDAPNQV